MSAKSDRERRDAFWTKKERRYAHRFPPAIREKWELEAHIGYGTSFGEGVQELSDRVDAFEKDLRSFKEQRDTPSSGDSSGKTDTDRRQKALLKRVHIVEFVDDCRPEARRGTQQIDWAKMVALWNADHPHDQYKKETLLGQYDRAINRDPDVRRLFHRRKPLRDARKFNNYVAEFRRKYAFLTVHMDFALQPIDVQEGEGPDEVASKVKTARDRFNHAIETLVLSSARTAKLSGVEVRDEGSHSQAGKG